MVINNSKLNCRTEDVSSVSKRHCNLLFKSFKLSMYISILDNLVNLRENTSITYSYRPVHKSINHFLLPISLSPVPAISFFYRFPIILKQLCFPDQDISFQLTCGWKFRWKVSKEFCFKKKNEHHYISILTALWCWFTCLRRWPSNNLFHDTSWREKALMGDKTSVFMWQVNVMGKEGRREMKQLCDQSILVLHKKNVQDNQRQGLD